MESKTYTLYRHIFPNGKSYVGITCKSPYYYRWRAGSGYCNQPKMYNAIKKYGWKNVKHEVLAKGLTREQANQVEQEMIAKYDSVSNGYNTSLGGGGTFGIPCAEETKKKIGLANRGKSNPHGADNFSLYRKEHGSWNRGKSLSPEHYQKIASERKERCNKAIAAYDPITKKCVSRFDSASEAAKRYGVSKSVISRCAHGGRKTSVGYVWRYDDASV